MRRRWVSSVILVVVVVVGGSFGAVAETATSKPVDLKLGVTGSPGRSVVAGDVLTVRASIQKLTATGGAATSFKFLYSLSGGLKLLGITTNAGKYDRGSGSVALMQLRPGKPIVLTIRVRVPAERVELGRILCDRGSGRRLEGDKGREQQRRQAVDDRAACEAERPRRQDHRRTRPDPPWVAEHVHRHRDEQGPDDGHPVPVASGHPARRSASYDNAKGGYNPTSGIWSGLSLARGGRVNLLVSGTTPTPLGTLTATAEISPLAGSRDPARAKQQVDRQDHDHHSLGPTTIER